MVRPYIIGVMGGGNAAENDLKTAYRLGALIAARGWILLNGGRNCGIMEASAKGAMDNGGITVGILPDADDSRISEYVSIPILTGMGNARNNINVLSSHFIIACPGGAGTLSEIALALKNKKPLILFNSYSVEMFAGYTADKDLVFFADTPDKAIDIIQNLIDSRRI